MVALLGGNFGFGGCKNDWNHRLAAGFSAICGRDAWSSSSRYQVALKAQVVELLLSASGRGPSSQLFPHDGASIS